MPELKIDIRVDSADGEKKLKSLGDTMDKAGKAGKKGMDDAAGSLDGLRKQTDSAGGGLDGLKKRFDTASSAASAFKGLLGAAGVLGALNLMVGGFTSAVKIGANFEQQMATVGGVMRASQADMAKLTAAARQMGETTEWSATQSAEALQYLGMAGFNATDAVKALPGMLDLATAGQLDLGKAADIATDGLTAMGMSVDQLGRFNDVLVGTITRSNTNIEQMGYSLKYVAPVASQMGYSIEQVSAAIGVMANAGLKGEMAGTGLSAVFLKLDKASKELGISSNRLPDVMQAIADAQWDATKIAKVFGDEQVKSVMVLKNGLGTYRDLEKQLQNTGGESKALADTMRSTTMGAFKELLSIIEDYGITGFERYKDRIKSSLTEAAGFLRAHKEDVFNALSGIESAITKTNSAMALLSGRTLTQAVIGNLTQSAEQGKAVVIQLGEEYKRQYDAHMGLLANSQAQKNAAAIEDIKRAEAAAAEQVKVQETAVKKMAKASEDHTKSEKKHIDDRLRAEKKAADDRERAYDRMYRDLGQQADGWKRHEIANLEKQRDEFVKSTGDKELAYKWFAAEVRKIDDELTKKLKDEEEKRQQASEDALKERASAYDTMFSDLGVKASGYREHELTILGRQRDDFIKHTGDKQLAYAWYAEKVKALDKGIADDVKSNSALNIGSWAWFEQEASKSMDALFEHGRSALSDGLFNLLKGDMDSLGDMWAGLWDDMLRIFADTISKMAIEWAVNGISNWISPGSGGVSTGGGGILGSLANTAVGKVAGKGWDLISGGGAIAAGMGGAGGVFMGGSALASDLYLGTGALVDVGGAAAGAAGMGTGMLGSIGAFITNPWTIGIGALAGAGLLASSLLDDPEKRQAIDTNTFKVMEDITGLSTSEDHGGGDASYGQMAVDVVKGVQDGVQAAINDLAAALSDSQKDAFMAGLDKQTVYLGGGGLKIREEHVEEDKEIVSLSAKLEMQRALLTPLADLIASLGDTEETAALYKKAEDFAKKLDAITGEDLWSGAAKPIMDEFDKWMGEIKNLAESMNRATEEATRTTFAPTENAVLDATTNGAEIFKSIEDKLWSINDKAFILVNSLAGIAARQDVLGLDIRGVIQTGSQRNADKLQENAQVLTDIREIAQVQLSAMRDYAAKPINISVSVGGEALDTRIRRIADEVRVEAERRDMGARSIY